MIHLTRMLPTTLCETKIRVNCVAPGLFPSEMTTGESDDKKLSNPAGSPGDNDDMVACILYLAGPGGLFLNPQVTYPDGATYLCSLLPRNLLCK